MMKQILLSTAFMLLLISCSGTDNVYKNSVLDYLQTDDGVKTDFKIKFHKFELSDITVADSIKILQEKYQSEKQKKIEAAQQDITHYENNIEKQNKKGGLVASALVSRFKEDLERAKEDLKKANEWTADYVHRYDDRSESEILGKKVDAYFSFQNPKLAQPTRQELGALFILSPDGTKCYEMIQSK